MERKSSFWLLVAHLVAVLMAALSSAADLNLKAYYVIGESLELRPSKVSSHITSVVWKFNGDMLVEWAKDAIPLEFYGTFKNRATLDQATGVLKINSMTKADSGRYTVEINNMVQTVEHDSVDIVKVPQPVAELKPLACGPASNSCILHCQGNTEGAGPVEFFFKSDDKEQKYPENKMEIQNVEEIQAVKKFSCKMKNPVSEKESEPITNKLFKEKVADSSGSGAIVGGVVGALVIIAAAAGVGYWKRDALMALFDHLQGGGGGGAASPQNGPQPPAPSKKDEEVPLNTNGNTSPETRAPETV